MPKVSSRRISNPSKIVSSKYTKKYSIKAARPMKTAKPVKSKIPTKVAMAKLDYDIAVEEQIQSSIMRDITAVEQQMVNERNRYQVVNKKHVSGEAQLINDPKSQNYSMLKRQQEQLQRQQESSNDRLFNLQTQKSVSVDPVSTASQSLRGISKGNPMKSRKRYVATMPEGTVASSGPLGNLGDTFKDVYSGVQGLIPSIPEASAFAGTGVIAKAASGWGAKFVSAKSAGDKRMFKKIIDAERKKAVEEAIKAGATPSEAKEIGLMAAAKTRSVLGEQKLYRTGLEAVPKTKTAFIKRRNPPKDRSQYGLTASESAMAERSTIEILTHLHGKKINPPKKGSGRFYDSNVAKKWIATGTVLGTGTMPLNAAYGEPMSFGQDFYKGFGQQKKQKKKKGRR